MVAESLCPRIVVEQDRYHSLEDIKEMDVIMETKATDMTQGMQKKY